MRTAKRKVQSAEWRLALALSICGALALGGCKGRKAPVGQPPMKVVLFMAGPATDRGLNQSARQALERLARSRGLMVDYASVPADKIRPALRQASRDRFHLAILLGGQYLQPAAETADNEDIGNVRLVCVGAEDVEARVEAVRLRVDQAAYLCGLIAGMTSQTRRGLALGQNHTALETDCLNAFINGTAAANPRFYCQVVHGGEPAQDVISAGRRGADMVFHMTSDPAAVFAGAASLPNVYAFGSFADQAALAPNVVLASAAVDMDAVFDGILARTLARSAELLVVHSLADGRIRLAINPRLADRITPAAMQRVRQAEQAITDGKLNVLYWPVPATQP